MQSEHQTHHAQPADRLIRGIRNIPIRAPDRRQCKSVLFPTGRRRDGAVVEIGQQGAFITRKVVVTRLGQRQHIEFRRRARVVRKIAVDESLRIMIPVICNDTVAQALHLRDGIGSSTCGNCRQNAAQKRRHAQQYREELIFYHNASYRTQPRR